MVKLIANVLTTQALSGFLPTFHFEQRALAGRPTRNAFVDWQQTGLQGEEAYLAVTRVLLANGVASGEEEAA